MKIGEWPQSIREVWLRRAAKAPRDFQQRAFGVSPVKSGYWRKDDLHIFAFGTGEFVSAVDKFDHLYGYPLPGIDSENTGEAVGIRFGGNNRSGLLADGSINSPQAVLLGRDANGPVTLLLWRMDIQCLIKGVVIKYHIPGAFLARFADGFSWEEAASDFDFLLSKAISPSIERR